MSQITTKWISDDAITPEKLADSSAFTMAGLTNNGPLSVSGDATFSSNAVIQGNVQIDGTTTFADATIASLNMTGDLSIGGTLDVLGTTTLSDATVNNNLKVEGTLTVIDTEIIVSDQLEVNQQADNQFAIKAIQAPGHTVSAVRVDNSGTGQSLYLNQIGSGTALQIASAGYAFVTTSGNVGLGTTVPLQSLDVRGTAIVSSGLGVGTTTVSTSGIEVYSSTGNNLGRFKSNDDTAYITVVDSDTTAVVLAKDSIASFGPSTSLSTNNINVKSTGEVGIGTTDPGEKLEVKGNFQIKDSASADVIFRAYASSDDGVLDVYRNNSVVVRIHGNSSSYFTGGSLGIGTTNPQAALHVFGDIVGKNDDTSDLGSTARRWANLYMASTVDYAGDLVFSSSGEKIRFTTGGSVGIGTTNPNAKLEVLSGTGDAIVGQSTSSAVVGQVTDAAGNCFDGRNSVGATVFSVNQSGAVSSLSYSQFSYIGIGATSSTYRLYVDDGRSSISHSAPFTTLTVTNSSTAAAIVGKSTSSAVVGQVTDAAGNCFEGRNSGDVVVFSVNQSGAVYSLSYSEFSYIGIGATNSTYRLYVDDGRGSISHSSPLTTLTVTNSSTAAAIVGKSTSSAVVGQVTDAAGNCFEGRNSGDVAVFSVDQSGAVSSLGYSEFSYVGIGATNSTFRLYVDNGRASINHNSPLTTLTVTNSSTAPAIVGKSTSSAVVGQVTDAAGNCLEGRNSGDVVVFSVDQSGAVSSLGYSEFSYVGIGATNSTYRLYVDNGRASISHSSPLTTFTVTNSSTAPAIVGKSNSSAVVGQVTDAAGNCLEGRDSGDNIVFRVDQSGQIYSDAGTTIITPADLAEWNIVDGDLNDYPVGTLVQQTDKDMVVGRANDKSNKIYGVVTDRAAFLGGLTGIDREEQKNMSSKELEEKYNAKKITMCGHVPVRLIGPVKAGQVLSLSDKPGVAKVAETQDEKINIFAISRESKKVNEEVLVECRIL